MTYKRVLLKLSGEALMGDKPYGIDPAIVQSIAEDVERVIANKVQLAIVVGGGNIFRGLKGSADGMDRATADYVGMLATVMNAISLQDGLERVGVETRVQTAIEMQEIAEPYIRRRAMRHLEKGRVVVFGGGCGNPFFTTDTTAALRAAEINAEVVMKATKVDGVYDRDPNKFKEAKKYSSLTYQQVLSDEIAVMDSTVMKATKVDGVYDRDPNKFKEAKKYSSLTYQQVLSDEIAVMDSTAIALCKDNNIPIMVFDIFKKGNISRAVAGESIGSLIS